jgi:metallo-beta-lactamase family protein
MKIKFLGAAGTVTGSKYLLTTGQRKYLVDCGLFQGLKHLRERNWLSLEIDPKSIDALFLTHAHIDHSGYIPRLVAMGFEGPIYCSLGTYDLVKILLPDSGHLQEEEARYANVKGYSKHKPALPLYTREQAEDCLKYFQPINFHTPIKLKDDTKITLSRAGHILGASCILLELAGRRIVFSGDVGRYNDIIMRPPEPLPDADYLVIESTYGNKTHDDEDVFQRLAKIINETVKRKGVIVIPSFAVGRAQQILYILKKLETTGKIPALKTYLDSPMAIDATDIYCKHHDDHRLNNEECQIMYDSAIFTKTPDESRAINDVPGSKIIISASGMASGGRILHHLSQYVTDNKNVIVIVGFQAEGTRGRALLEGISEIKIFGQHFKVAAKIENISTLSAHGDSNELIRWLNESHLKHPKVFVTHGEKSASETFAEKLRNTFHWHVEVPKDKEEYNL